MPNQQNPSIVINVDDAIIPASELLDANSQTTQSTEAIDKNVWGHHSHQTFWNLLKQYQHNPYLNLTTLDIIAGWWLAMPELGNGASTVFSRIQNFFGASSSPYTEFLIFRDNCVIWDRFESIKQETVHIRRTCHLDEMRNPKIELRLSFVSEKNNLNVFHKTMPLNSENIVPLQIDSNQSSTDLADLLQQHQYINEKNTKIANYLPITNKSETIAWLGGTALNLLSYHWMEAANVWANPYFGKIARDLNLVNQFFAPILTRQYRSLKNNYYRKGLHTMLCLLSGTATAANLIENYALNGDTLAPETQNSYFNNPLENPWNWYFLYFNTFALSHTVATVINGFQTICHLPFYQTNKNKNLQAASTTACNFLSNAFNMAGYLSLLPKLLGDNEYRDKNSSFAPVDQTLLWGSVSTLVAQNLVNMNHDANEFVALNKNDSQHYYEHANILKTAQTVYLKNELKCYYEFEKKQYEQLPVVLVNQIFQQIYYCEAIDEVVKDKLLTDLYLHCDEWIAEFNTFPPATKKSLQFKKTWIKQQAEQHFSKHQSLIAISQKAVLNCEPQNPPNYYLISNRFENLNANQPTFAVNAGASTSHDDIIPATITSIANFEHAQSC